MAQAGPTIRLTAITMSSTALAFRVSGRFDITDVRWIDIDADASVDGANVGSVAVDPLVYGVYGSLRF
jgi:outer membrane protein